MWIRGQGRRKAVIRHEAAEKNRRKIKNPVERSISTKNDNSFITHCIPYNIIVYTYVLLV